MHVTICMNTIHVYTCIIIMLMDECTYEYRLRRPLPLQLLLAAECDNCLRQLWLLWRRPGELLGAVHALRCSAPGFRCSPPFGLRPACHWLNMLAGYHKLFSVIVRRPTRWPWQLFGLSTAPTPNASASYRSAPLGTHVEVQLWWRCCTATSGVYAARKAV